jgi:hypothetical protein
MSETVMTIREKLFHIQQELIAPKNQYNSFGKYKYRSLEDIMVASKPLLAKYECTLTFDDVVSSIATGVFAMECFARLTCIKSGEEIFACSVVGVDPNKKGMDIAQSFGASSSYGRKYAANALFLIDDTKDADATNKHGKDTQSTPDSEKPYLMKTDPHYRNAIDYIAKGGTIEHIKMKYRLTPEVEASLQK